MNISADEPEKWLSYMRENNPKGIDFFEVNLVQMKTCVLSSPGVWNLSLVAKQLACAYKFGSPFPSHFIYANKSYNMEEPAFLYCATKVQKKNHLFLEEIFKDLTTNGDANWLLFATLMNGLTFGGKIAANWFDREE